MALMVTGMLVDIGWGNGLAPDNTKPISELMMTYSWWDYQKHYSVKFYLEYEKMKMRLKM